MISKKIRARNMQDRFTVSIHIPKTAGTTLAEVFSRTLKRRIVFDYEGYENPANPNTLILEHKEFVEQYFKVLHGHFYATKYLDVFPDAAFISTVRHPVDRVISQYLHEYNEQSGDAAYHAAIREGRMSVIDFAEQPGIGDAMQRHLQGRALADYDLLLVSEDFLRSVVVFAATIADLPMQYAFGVPVQLPRMNEGVARMRGIDFDEKTRQEIFARTQPDNAVYAEAVSLLAAKVERYL
jgi:hypothetical protein